MYLNQNILKSSNKPDSVELSSQLNEKQVIEAKSNLENAMLEAKEAKKTSNKRKKWQSKILKKLIKHKRK